MPVAVHWACTEGKASSYVQVTGESADQELDDLYDYYVQTGIVDDTILAPLVQVGKLVSMHSGDGQTAASCMESSASILLAAAVLSAGAHMLCQAPSIKHQHQEVLGSSHAPCIVVLSDSQAFIAAQLYDQHEADDEDGEAQLHLRDDDEDSNAEGYYGNDYPDDASADGRSDSTCAETGSDEQDWQ